MLGLPISPISTFYAFCKHDIEAQRIAVTCNSDMSGRFAHTGFVRGHVH